MDKAELEWRVARGWTIRAIAEDLGVSPTTVSHWLRRHEVQTVRALRLATTREARLTGAASLEGECTIHGRTTMVLRGPGNFRCRQCRSDAVTAWRRRVKALLVAEAGGACLICGYDQHLAALHFHHLDPATKAFSLSGAGVTRSLQRARAEARKCALLCANCHAAVEAGILRLPSAPTRADLQGAVSGPG